jgi:hypothetical protein
MPPAFVPNPMPMPMPMPPYFSKVMTKQMKHEQVKELMKLYHVCCKNGLYDEAEDIAVKAHRMEPQNVAVAAAIRVAHRLAGKAKPGAVKETKQEKCTQQSQAPQNFPSSMWAEECKEVKVEKLMKQFSTLFKQGKYDEARICAQKVLELDPCHVVAGAVMKLPKCDAGHSPSACFGVAKGTDCCMPAKMNCCVYPVADITGEGCAPGTFVGRNHPSIDTLVKIVCDSVAPETWSQKGGAGTITPCFFGQLLVVRQTPEVQEQVAEMLAGMRRFPR